MLELPGPAGGIGHRITTLTGADTDAPLTPSGLAGVPGSQQVVLSWSANGELDLAGYSVFRRLSGEADFVEIASRLTAPTYTDLGLSNDSAYDYQITAIDRADNASAATEVLSLTPTALAAPSAPTGLSQSIRHRTPCLKAELKTW